MRTLPIEGQLMDKLVQGLSKSPLFASLKPEQLQQITARAEFLQYDAGEGIVEEGEVSDSFFFLLNGEARVLVGGGKPEPIEVGILQHPDCFGEMGLLLDKPRSATVTARSAIALLKFNAQLFSYFMQKIPEFGLSISRHLATRLALTSHQLPLATSADQQELPTPEVLGLLPREILERQRVVPLKTEGNLLYLGFVLDPTPQVLAVIRPQLPSMDIKPVRVSTEFLERCLRSNASSPGWSAAEQPTAQSQPAAAAAVDDDRPRHSPKLDVLLRRMVAEWASDIHLSGKQSPRWRIDGEMLTIEDLPVLRGSEVHELVKPIMREANLQEYLQTNDTDFAYAIEGVSRFRVNLFRDRGGVSAVFRQIPDKILTIEQLGLPSIVQSVCEYPKGLILVTGPTGSGKSTTLAAMIDHVNKTKKSHIITLEDPIEFVHKSQACLMNQREVGTHTKSFSRALRAALREDPDIVLVGEMRDLETVSLALETANTGHLVFGTLHTSTAISTVDRIIDLFPSEQQNQVRVVLADSLRCVISQMLCRKIGGGRIGVQEILVSNAAVANLIREAKNNQIATIMTTQRALGNRMLNDELAKLVNDKVIQYEEALAKAIDKPNLAKLCNQPPPKI